MIRQHKRHFSKTVETEVGRRWVLFYFLKEKKSERLSLRLRKPLASSTPLLQLWLLCSSLALNLSLGVPSPVCLYWRAQHTLCIRLQGISLCHSASKNTISASQDSCERQGWVGLVINAARLPLLESAYFRKGNCSRKWSRTELCPPRSLGGKDPFPPTH